MGLMQLVYASRIAKIEMGKLLMEDLLVHARSQNERSGISGYLSFGNGFFLQLIEGSASAVTSVYGRIANDKRHSELLLIGYKSVSRRRFPGWTMGYAAITGQAKHILYKFSEADEFTPHNMSFKCARNYLVHLDAWMNDRNVQAREKIRARPAMQDAHITSE